MKIVPAKCPNCGANIDVDEEQETTKCEYCGDAILIDRAIEKYKIEVKVTNLPDLNNLLVLGERAYTGQDYSNAYEYYKKAIMLDPYNYIVVLRLALSKAFIDNYDDIDLSLLETKIIDSIEISLGDKEKYKRIVSESLECVKHLEKESIRYYESNILNKSAASWLNNRCIEILKLLEKLLFTAEEIDNNDEQKRSVQKNIIEFTEFVIKPKVYETNYVKRNGKRSKNSLKLKRNNRKKIYAFWNNTIDKYNSLSEDKISNKKMPFFQIDFHTLKAIGAITLLILVLLYLIFLLFFNKETYGEYSSSYNCSNYKSLSINEISLAKYDKNKKNNYINNIYNFEGTISNIQLDSDHPYFSVNYNGIKIYINQNDNETLSKKKQGDKINFCGIVKESNRDKIKIENASISRWIVETSEIINIEK